MAVVPFVGFGNKKYAGVEESVLARQGLRDVYEQSRTVRWSRLVCKDATMNSKLDRVVGHVSRRVARTRACWNQWLAMFVLPCTPILPLRNLSAFLST